MSFTLEVSVTEKCNLGCPYCYVANKPTFMTIEQFDKTIPELYTLIKNSGELTYQVSFFGGEPMLNWELVEYASKYFNNDKRCVGLNIITNLTLIDEEKLKFIKKNKIGVSWSFDGMSSNNTRPLLPVFENKNPETGNMFNGILELYESKRELIKDLNVQQCKVMIWPGNTTSMTENFEFLNNWGISQPDFSIVRDDVWTIDDLHTFKTEVTRLADKYIEYQRNGISSSIGFFRLSILDILLGIVKGKRKTGCFAGTHGAVMMSSGEFYPCARFASKKIMKIDEGFDFKYYQDIFSPKSYTKCKSCDLIQVCNAGCTYSQVMNNNTPVDSICELFHMITTESLRIVEECKEFPAFRNMVKSWVRNIRNESCKN